MTIRWSHEGARDHTTSIRLGQEAIVMSDTQGPSTEAVAVPEAAHEWHKVLDPDDCPRAASPR